MRSSVVMISIAMFASLATLSSAEDSCYTFNNNPYLNFATKTAYEYVYNKKGIPTVPECRPVQVWLVSRHGTRWPGADDIPEFSDLKQIRDHIISNYNSNRGSLCVQDIDKLKAWQFSMTEDQGDMLTKQGREDLYFIGRRLRSYFPELFNISYSADKMIFRHTDTPRTKESAEYFARGVLGLSMDDVVPSLPAPVSDDRLLYGYRNCPAWDSKEDEDKQEFNKFGKSQYMTNVIYNVSRRLGFDYNLTKGNIKEIYNGCRYQKAWNVTSVSPWCAAFSKEDLEVLEYNEDLKFYYTSGPGNPMNLRLACPLVKDLFNRFSAMEAQPGGDHPAGVFYFSHHTMVEMLSARLGLNDDYLPLTADNFPQQQHRQFRSSFISPFAGNVIAVMYNCSRGDPLQTIFYQEEDIVRYPGCSVGLCEWSYIKQRFASFVQDSACTDDSYCFNKSGAHINTSGTLVMATVILFTLAQLLFS